MDVRRLLPAVYVLCLLFCGVIAASAQSCANLGCQRPPDNSSCYTCTDVGGVNCSVSNCSSCTESTCQSSTDPCSINPIADGCTNPCLSDPSAPVCCGTQIICEGAGGGTGGGGGGGGGGSGTGITGHLQPIFPPVRHKLDLTALMATFKRAPATSGCQPMNLPNRLLFSL